MPAEAMQIDQPINRAQALLALFTEAEKASGDRSVVPDTVINYFEDTLPNDNTVKNTVIRDLRDAGLNHSWDDAINTFCEQNGLTVRKKRRSTRSSSLTVETGSDGEDDVFRPKSPTKRKNKESKKARKDPEADPKTSASSAASADAGAAATEEGKLLTNPVSFVTNHLLNFIKKPAILTAYRTLNPHLPKEIDPIREHAEEMLAQNHHIVGFQGFIAAYHQKSDHHSIIDLIFTILMLRDPLIPKEMKLADFGYDKLLEYPDVIWTQIFAWLETITKDSYLTEEPNPEDKDRHYVCQYLIYTLITLLRIYDAPTDVKELITEENRSFLMKKSQEALLLLEEHSDKFKDFERELEELEVLKGICEKHLGESMPLSPAQDRSGAMALFSIHKSRVIEALEAAKIQRRWLSGFARAKVVTHLASPTDIFKEQSSASAADPTKPNSPPTSKP